MGQWVHRLSNINLHAMTATCESCGPVSIWMKNQGHGQLMPRCKNAELRWHKRNGRHHYRPQVGDKCERCGFVAVVVDQLDVHHKDGNRKHNRPANLETLCANCHRLEHASKKKG
jgi:hypothetical protein